MQPRKLLSEKYKVKKMKTGKAVKSEEVGEVEEVEEVEEEEEVDAETLTLTLGFRAIRETWAGISEGSPP